MKFFLGPRNDMTNNIIKMDQKIIKRSPISYSIGTWMLMPAKKILNFSKFFINKSLKIEEIYYLILGPIMNFFLMLGLVITFLNLLI